MTQSGWMPLKLLKQRFTANVTALATRYPDEAERLLMLVPSEPYFIQTEGDRIYLGMGEPVRPLPVVLSPPAAQDIVSKMFPGGKYEEASLIAGEDVGWLWNALYRLPCHSAKAPGYRPPLFFLMRNIERLWAILHVQDWQQLLADERVRFFIGENIVERFSESLHTEPMCPWPKLSVTVDPAIWPAGVSLETVIAQARERQSQNLVTLLDRLHLETNKPTPAQLADRIKSGLPLRIMGLTSRYTTFLQYSMRDWLAGLQRLGHQTKLFIEPFDYQVANNLVIARACGEFRPDLIIAIDHSRPSLFGVLDDIPVVMWVQDRLPNIFDQKTGSSLGPMDYVIGFARQELTQRYGYPASRFMPAMVGVNNERFLPRELTWSEWDRYGCEVSFVSHATLPADQIIKAEMKKQEKHEARALLDDMFQQLRAVYEAGNSISNGHVIEKMINETLLRRGLKSNREGMIDLFIHRVNNALFRHQSVRWAAESGANLHLYGNGWENHAEFSRFARGVADNQDQLPIIYQASAINLQVTPFGAVHQRLLDGLVAGGFFLLRSVTADELEPLRRQIWDWCKNHQVHSGAEMMRNCDDDLSALLFRFQSLWAIDPRADIEYFYTGLDEAAISDFQRTANTFWIESPRVTFSTQSKLTDQIRHFMANPDERKSIACLMRQRVLETHTYQAVSKRMLDFIAADLEKSVRKNAA